MSQSCSAATSTRKRSRIDLIRLLSMTVFLAFALTNSSIFRNRVTILRCTSEEANGILSSRKSLGRIEGGPPQWRLRVCHVGLGSVSMVCVSLVVQATEIELPFNHGFFPAESYLTFDRTEENTKALRGSSRLSQLLSPNMTHARRFQETLQTQNSHNGNRGS
jgi:hypothetical protein